MAPDQPPLFDSLRCHFAHRRSGTFTPRGCQFHGMALNRRNLVLVGMLLVATAGFVMQRQRTLCWVRQVLRLNAICVPGDARRFDVFDGGLVLVGQLCHAVPSRPNCLAIQAEGKWENGRLDTTFSDGRVRYRVLEDNNAICELDISEGLAVRSAGKARDDIATRWPTCSSADLWRDAALLGYRLPPSAELRYGAHGLSLTLYDANYNHWALSAWNACIGDPANDVQSDRTLQQPMSLLARMRAEEKSTSNTVEANLAPLTPSQREKIIAVSRIGCRAPTEPGCAKCCVSRADGCDRFHWNGEGMPFYDGHEKFESPCDLRCRPCASCSKSDESLLNTYAPRRECDCRQPRGIDPCFSADSCGCYCEYLKPLLLACPGQIDQQ